MKLLIPNLINRRLDRSCGQKSGALGSFESNDINVTYHVSLVKKASYSKPDYSKKGDPKSIWIAF
tara:strand:- start:843 stop:1037 length:195 start_codon:yes stop_codon:yes gene_type:complete